MSVPIFTISLQLIMISELLPNRPNILPPPEITRASSISFLGLIQIVYKAHSSPVFMFIISFPWFRFLTYPTSFILVPYYLYVKIGYKYDKILVGFISSSSYIFSHHCLKSFFSIWKLELVKCCNFFSNFHLGFYPSKTFKLSICFFCYLIFLLLFKAIWLNQTSSSAFSIPYLVHYVYCIATIMENWFK